MNDFDVNMIGRYRIIETIEQNEFTITYKAHDNQLGRYVVLKTFPHSKDYYSENFSDIFVQKARGLAKLTHKGIAKIYDYGNYEGLIYIVSEFISDQSLASKLGSPLDWNEALNCIIPIAEALEYAHENGVIHRDLKPENIFINSENEPVICDFSIVQILENEETQDLTGTYVGLGSPSYISPEQGRGLSVDNRTDIYSLGILLYEMVTGKKPFHGEYGMEVVIQQVTLIPTSPRKIIPELPISVEKIILKALRKNPDERFQSMDEFIVAIKTIIDESDQKIDKSNQFKQYILKGFEILLVISCIFLIGVAIFRYNTKPLSQKQNNLIESTKTFSQLINQPTSQPTMDNPQTALFENATSIPLNSLPKYPLLEGAPLPSSTEIISPGSILKIRELARWGSPKVNDISWFRDDKEIIAASSVGVFFYEKNGLNAQDFMDTKGWITALCANKDSKKIATGDLNGNIRVWDASTGNELFTLIGHTSEITTLQFSEDGKKLVSGSSDHTIKIWDSINGKDLFTLNKHAYAVNAAIFSYDGKFVISGADDFQLIIWDAETGELLKQIAAGHMIRDVAVSHDNSFIAAALKDAKIEIWGSDIVNPTLLRTLKDPAQIEAVTTLSISPTDYFLAAGSDDGRIRVWNLSNGKLDFTLHPSFEGEKIDINIDGIKNVAFSSEGDRIVSQTKAGKITIWDFVSEQAIASKVHNWIETKHAIFNFSSSRLIVQTNKSDVVIWDLLSGNRVANFLSQLPNGSPSALNSNMIALTSTDQILISDTNQVIRTISRSNYATDNILSFFSNDRIIGSSSLRALTLWAVNTGQEIEPAKLQVNRNCQVAYSNDNEFLAAGSNLGIFSDEQIADNFCKINKNPRSIDSAFTTDGKFLAFGLETKKIELWEDSNDFQESTLLDDGDGRVMDIAFSPDNRLLASANEDGKVRIWDPISKQILMTLDHHHAPVQSVTFSNNGRWLATTSSDGSIEIWGIID